MHKKIFFIIAVILINKNIMPSLSESNIDRDSDTIPYSIDADIDTDINTDRGSDTSEMPPIGRITNPRQITNSTIYHPTSEITPVVERIVHQRQNRSRIQPTIADQQRKDRILHTITRILSIANSGYIRSIPMDYRKTLTIAPREGESITEVLNFKYQNRFSRNRQKEMDISIFECRHDDFPNAEEINNVIMNAPIDFRKVSQISSILHCLCTGQIAWVSDELTYEIF